VLAAQLRGPVSIHSLMHLLVCTNSGRSAQKQASPSHWLSHRAHRGAWNSDIRCPDDGKARILVHVGPLQAVLRFVCTVGICYQLIAIDSPRSGQLHLIHAHCLILESTSSFCKRLLQVTSFGLRHTCEAASFAVTWGAYLMLQPKPSKPA